MTDKSSMQKRELAEALNKKYEEYLPDIGSGLVEWLFTEHYDRSNLDIKTRKIVSVAVLTALGDQTKPQLRLNISDALQAGASKEELAEAIWQVGIYAGMPADINGLNTALQVFNEDTS